MKANDCSFIYYYIRQRGRSGMARKVFLRVVAEFDEHGRITPLSLTWEDGHHYPIDRVMDISPAVSFKVGGCGIRYVCRIQGHQVFLFQDGNQWYLESQDSAR
jgi:hypothetical protein